MWRAGRLPCLSELLGLATPKGPFRRSVPSRDIHRARFRVPGCLPCEVEPTLLRGGVSVKRLGEVFFRHLDSLQRKPELTS